ncbi:diversity-generating retroelement protein Avd [Candidatus Daviesbacteria bacterium]|nr:diversity-generating retroelement protein Avd [Candidatus Daviesbacteria bacterium]
MNSVFSSVIPARRFEEASPLVGEAGIHIIWIPCQARNDIGFFMADQLIIYQKFYDLVVWLFPVINRIPKSHRMVVGKHLEELCISILLLLIKANKSRGQERAVMQQNISDELDCLRILTRLTKDLRLMSVKQYTLASEKLNEIGRIMTGWVKCQESKEGIKQQALL